MEVAITTTLMAPPIKTAMGAATTTLHRTLTEVATGTKIPMGAATRRLRTLMVPPTRTAMVAATTTHLLVHTEVATLPPTHMAAAAEATMTVQIPLRLEEQTPLAPADTETTPTLEVADMVAPMMTMILMGLDVTKARMEAELESLDWVTR